jgi:hypothetical protein
VGDGEIARLVTSAEIARLAGVGRAAVSNWRRRYPDFPKPAGGPDSSPTFSIEEVTQWLAATGKGKQLRVEGVTKTGTHRLDRATRQTLPRTQNTVGGEPVPGPSLRAATRTSWSSKSTADVVGERTRRQRSRFADMLVALLPDETSGPVIDPACGRGDLLHAAAVRFGNAVELLGLDVEQDAVSRTAALLDDAADVDNLAGAASAPSRTRATLRAAVALTDQRLRMYRGAAVAVLCELPTAQPQWLADQSVSDRRWVFGIPAPRDADLAWAQLCYDLLRPRGTAVLALSARTCVQGSGRSIRAAMLRAGVLSAVIALPEGADPDSVHPRGVGSVLWVLRRPTSGAPERTVAMVDLSDILPQEIPTDHAAWTAVKADPTHCRDIAAIDLLDDEVALLPSRFVERDTGEQATAYLRAADRLPVLLERLAEGLPRLDRSPTKPGFHLVPLHELEQVGSLRIRPRTVTPRVGDVLVHAGSKPPTVVTAASDGTSGYATTNEEAAIAHVIEIATDRLDPYFVAGFLQADASAIPIVNTAGTLSRDDLRRCRIPRLPLAQQQRYGAAFRKLADLESVLRKATELSGDVLRAAADGLTSGALAPPE